MERELTVPQQELTLPTPDQREKSGAAVMHIGAIFAPIIVPAIVYFITRKKADYINAHARQSLVETLWLNVFLGLAILTSLYFTFSGIWQHYQEGWVDWDWTEQLLKFGIKAVISWILLGILGFFNTVVSILQAVKAWQGEWPKSWRKKMAKARI